MRPDIGTLSAALCQLFPIYKGGGRRVYSLEVSLGNRKTPGAIMRWFVDQLPGDAWLLEEDGTLFFRIPTSSAFEVRYVRR